MTPHLIRWLPLLLDTLLYSTEYLIEWVVHMRHKLVNWSYWNEALKSRTHCVRCLCFQTVHSRKNWHKILTLITHGGKTTGVWEGLDPPFGSRDTCQSAEENQWKNLRNAGKIAAHIRSELMHTLRHCNEYKSNDELMKRAGMEDLSNIVRVRSLTLVGHILRLPSDRPASVAMQWEPDRDRRRRGRPRKTWRQKYREDLQEMRVSWSGVRRVASDRSQWKSLVAQCSSRNGRI